MCRHLAYVGPPVSLASLVLDPPHSLRVQSYAPREQVSGKVNADGFGVGWYAPDVRPEPAVFRSVLPIWADTSFASVAPVVRSSVIVAAARSATPPNPTEVTGTAPFAHGRWLFSLNGWIDGFADGRGVTLRRALPPELDGRIRSASDADLLFSMILAELLSGAAPEAAVADVVGKLRADNDGPLNVLLTDGEILVATRSGNSLHHRVHEDGSTLLASEPLDDSVGRWHPAPDGRVVVAHGADVKVLPL